VEAAVIKATVPLTEAEASLAGFWREADDEARAQGRAGALRLRALNLLVLAGNREQVDAADRVLDEVAPHHPARVVMFRLGEASPRPGPLDVDVASATCLSRDGIQQVCREQITIPVTGSEPLVALAEPLLLPDAPIVLWVPGPPDLVADPLRVLADLAERVIVDSASLEDPVNGLRYLAGMPAPPARGFTLTDLNWARLTPWRELTADLFDDPRRRVLLGRVRRLRVSYASQREEEEGGAGRGSQAAAGLLYAGWVAGRLEWTVAGQPWRPDDPGYATSFLRATGTADAGGLIPLAGQTIVATLQPRRCRSVAEVGLEAVVLEAGEGPAGSPVVISLTRTPGDTPSEGVCATRVTEGTEETQMRTMTLPYPPVAELLAAELDYSGRDSLYEESLAIAARLAALSGAAVLGE
jgi:glucose-6-phosphate dehydrogenase assembly protein OpcA